MRNSAHSYPPCCADQGKGAPALEPCWGAGMWLQGKEGIRRLQAPELPPANVRLWEKLGFQRLCFLVTKTRGLYPPVRAAVKHARGREPALKMWLPAQRGCPSCEPPTFLPFGAPAQHSTARAARQTSRPGVNAETTNPPPLQAVFLPFPRGTQGPWAWARGQWPGWGHERSPRGDETVRRPTSKGIHVKIC